jgi:serine protease
VDFRRDGQRLTGRAELDALQEYARRLTRSNAAFAHPNWVMELGRTLRLEQLSTAARVGSKASLPVDASDPALKTGLLWHYQATPSGMNALSAWDMNKGSRDVVVAVIDTGILPDHPDIKGSGNVLAGYNFISDPDYKGRGPEGPDPDSTDRSDRCSELLGSAWHGTHVAGTVGAASSNNDIGIVGVNWQVSVLPIRAMGRCGRGTLADLAAAVTWAAGLPVLGVPPNPRKADVINLSLSMGQACQTQNVGLLKQALDDAREAGSIVVAAAGNKKSDIKDVTPAGCKGVISVAASDARGHLAPYSNFGNVTVMAPGGDLDRDDDDDNRPDGIWSLVAPSGEYPSGVAAMEGTSMAAPHVAAAIALALSAKPELRGRPDEIEKLLKRTLARLPPGACRKPCGPGLLDAKAMIQPDTVTSSTKR